MQYHELLELIGGFFGVGVAILGLVHYLATRSRLSLLASIPFLFGGSLLVFEVLFKLFPAWKSLWLPAVSGFHSRLLFGGLLLAALLVDRWGPSHSSRTGAWGSFALGWLAALVGTLLVFSLPLPPKPVPGGLWGCRFSPGPAS
jgi:hypothetical protein